MWSKYTMCIFFTKFWVQNRGSLLHLLSCWFLLCFTDKVISILKQHQQWWNYTHSHILRQVNSPLCSRRFFSMVRILMFSRSDGPKWSYFRTCVFNPCVNFASKGNSCSYYKRYIFEGLKLNRNIIYTWYKAICLVYVMY